MANANNQAQNLLTEFKAVNKKAADYLSQVNKKIAELDIKYAQSLVKYDINILKAAKSILLNKKS